MMCLISERANERDCMCVLNTLCCCLVMIMMGGLELRFEIDRNVVDMKTSL